MLMLMLLLLLLLLVWLWTWSWSLSKPWMILGEKLLTTASFNFHFKTSVDNIASCDHKNTSRLHPVVRWSDHSLSTTKSNHPPSSWLLLGLQAGCCSNVRWRLAPPQSRFSQRWRRQLLLNGRMVADILYRLEWSRMLSDPQILLDTLLYSWKLGYFWILSNTLRYSWTLSATVLACPSLSCPVLACPGLFWHVLVLKLLKKQ